MTETDDLDFLLRRIGDESKPVRATALAPLSDLSRGQMQLFRETWAALTTERRLELARELVEQAEANVRLNFCAILRDCLDDGDEQVRKLAIEGLWEDCRPNLVGPLISLLSEDPSVDVRTAAAISLGRFVLMGELGDVSETVALQAAEALRSAWFRPNEENEVRRRALEGMAYTGDPAVRDLIQGAYYDEDALMRQSAIFSMGRSVDRRWSKPVLTELASHDAAMRFEAASAAGELGLTAAVQPLIQLLDDPDSSVREASALALGKIGGPEARRALQACVESGDERLVQAAEEAMEELAFNSGSMDNPLFDFSGHVDGDRLSVDGDVDDNELFDEYDEEDVLGDGLGTDLLPDADLLDLDEDDLAWDEDEEDEDEEDEEEWD